MYNRNTFPGQRGGGDGRDQPSRGRAHEPHRLLLTDGKPTQRADILHVGDRQHASDEKEHVHNQRGDTKDKKTSNDYLKKDISDIDSTVIRGLHGENVSRQDACNSSDKYSLQVKTATNNNDLQPVHGYHKRESVEHKNVPLPGSTIKTHPAANYTLPGNSCPSTDALNTVGIPVYNNSLSHNYLYTNHPVPSTNYYIPGLSEPSSPSNYPTMIMGHPGHPSHAIVFENDSRPTRNRPLPTHILLTSNMKRTKHLKPPAKSKLKSKTVTIHHITPIVYPVQSSSQSALFHAPSNYALPASHPNQQIVNHQNTNQQQPISIAVGGQYSQRDQRYTTPPTAPVLYEEEPSPLISNGLPPAYATIDPKKLRNRHIRPAVFKRRGMSNSRQYQLL